MVTSVSRLLPEGCALLVETRTLALDAYPGRRAPPSYTKSGNLRAAVQVGGAGPTPSKPWFGSWDICGVTASNLFDVLLAACDVLRGFGASTGILRLELV